VSCWVLHCESDPREFGRLTRHALGLIERAQGQHSASYAKLVWPFVSKDKERYYLNGLHVYKHPSGGAIIAGSDGISIGVF
jgi:hypothetical protein